MPIAGDYKLMLTVGDGLTVHDINYRIESIEELIIENKYNIDFNPNSDARLLELNKTVDSD